MSQSIHSFIDREHPDDYRREEVAALVRAIHARENRLVVGLPGVGVSNLLRFLVSRRAQVEAMARAVAGKPIALTFAYAPCETLGGAAAWPALFDDVADQLQRQGVGGAAEDEHGYERFRRLLGDAASETWTRLVIVIDNADGLLADAGEALYAQLKGLTNINKGVCFIVGTGALLSEQVDPQGLLFAGRRLRVGCLAERDFAAVMREEADRLGTTFDEADVARLSSLVGGHPGLLRAVSSAVTGGALPLLGPEAALTATLLARDDVTRRCKRLWDGMTPAEQTALKAIATGRKADTRSAALATLRDFGLVVGEPPRVRATVLAGFAAAQETTLELIWIEYPRYNELGIILSGIVKQGDRTVHITPNALKLIACLAHEPRSFSKDQVWQYVYHDYYAAGAAVSDATIDNLVSDVRSQLGNKEYIKAAYGQGLMLQQYRPPSTALPVHPDACTVGPPR